MEEKKFIITEDQIEELNSYLKNHSLVSVKGILKQLRLFNEDEEVRNLKNKIKSLESKLNLTGGK